MTLLEFSLYISGLAVLVLLALLVDAYVYYRRLNAKLKVVVDEATRLRIAGASNWDHGLREFINDNFTGQERDEALAAVDKHKGETR